MRFNSGPLGHKIFQGIRSSKKWISIQILYGNIINFSRCVLTGYQWVVSCHRYTLLFEHIFVLRTYWHFWIHSFEDRYYQSELHPLPISKFCKFFEISTPLVIARMSCLILRILIFFLYFSFYVKKKDSVIIDFCLRWNF